MQGDVVAVYNESGTLLVSYTYDAWGNFTETVNGTSNEFTFASDLPFRYRGYYYDEEIGLYYLNTRYYDANIGRFINADSQLNTSLGVLGYNMFTYCLNNPTNKVDFDGNKPGDLFDTMDEAAIDFAEYINRTSINQNREYSSYIYTKEVWETKTITFDPNMLGNSMFYRVLIMLFGFGSEITITIRVKVTKYAYVTPRKWFEHNCFIPINWFGIHNQVALLHTHGAYSSRYMGDVFSPKDKKLAKKRGMPFYLATPLGILRKYDPSNWSDVVISEDIPFDPNHPKRR